MLLVPLGLLYRLWTRTVRMEFSSPKEETALRDVSEPTIILTWHNRLFLGGEYVRRFRKGRIVTA